MSFQTNSILNVTKSLCVQKKYFLTLCLSILIQFNTYAHSWAPIGAMWHIGIIESFCCPNQGGITITSVSDSVILSKNCKVLISEYKNSNSVIYNIDTAYQYDSNGVIYEYINYQFYTLFDFSANAGDTWNTLVPYPSPFTMSGNSPDTIVTIVVDSVSSMLINGQNHKLLFVHSQNNDWYFSNPIIEGIGSRGGLHPFIYDWMDAEIPFLRCYSDSTINYIIQFPCENIVNGIEKLAKSTPELIFPNPCNNKLTIINEETGFTRIKINDLYGKLLKEEGFKSINSYTLNLEDLLEGIYLISILNYKNEWQSFKFSHLQD
jgi:hypothetical protein